MLTDFELDIQENNIRTLLELDGRTDGIIKSIHSSGVLAFIQQARAANRYLAALKDIKGRTQPDGLSGEQGPNWLKIQLTVVHVIAERATESK